MYINMNFQPIDISDIVVKNWIYQDLSKVDSIADPRRRKVALYIKEKFNEAIKGEKHKPIADSFNMRLSICQHYQDETSKFYNNKIENSTTEIERKTFQDEKKKIITEIDTQWDLIIQEFQPFKNLVYNEMKNEYIEKKRLERKIEAEKLLEEAKAQTRLKREKEQLKNLKKSLRNLSNKNESE